MKKSNSKKKKALLGLAALAAIVALVSGTYAWDVIKDQRINRVSTRQLSDPDSVKIVENWSPPKKWTPGTTAVKEVQVSNTGDTPVLVRVSFEEVLKQLASFGKETDAAAAYDKAKIALTDDVPVEVTINETALQADGWVDISTKAKVTGTTKVFARGKAEADTINNGVNFSYEVMAFNNYDTGKYQKTVIDLKLKSNPTAGQTVDQWDWDGEGKAVKYRVYAGGYKYSMANWTTDKVSDLLNTAGTKYSVEYDYTPAGTGMTADAIKAAIETAKKPTAAVVAAEQDKLPAMLNANLPKEGNAAGDSLQINFTDKLKALPTLEDKKGFDQWFYNEADGYFYYLKKLGTGKTTEQLLKSLTLDNKANEAYINMTYDLIVKSDAVIADADAVSEVWGVTSTSDLGKQLTNSINEIL